MLIEYEYNKTFWETDGGILLKNIEPVIKIRDAFGEEKASRVMWGILLIYDWDSTFANMEQNEKIKFIEKEYIKVEHGFLLANNEIVKDFIELFNQMQETSERRYIKSWEKKVEDRRVFLDNLDYDATTFAIIDKMLLESEKILAMKEGILKRIEKQGGTELKGGQKLSMLAEGKIKV